MDEREDFRQRSFVALFASKRIIGKGVNGYLEAIDYLSDGV